MNESSLLADLEAMPEECRECMIRQFDKCAERGYNIPTGQHLRIKLRERELERQRKTADGT